MKFSQIFEMINIGAVILDRELKVCYWNPWMEIHSGITAEKIIGSQLLDFFPNLNQKKFLRNCKSVLNFGNLSFFSQRLHQYFFPFKPITAFDINFEYMQQSCTMGPMREQENGGPGSIEHIYIIVQDVTELVAYEKKLIDMNMKDGLTGVFNRRHIDKCLKDEFSRHKRYSRPMSFVLFDIDFFKKINDTYGHQCGDFVLQALSSRIKAIIRNVDAIGRYGGEEFCCVLPETDMDAALLLAERFRLIIAGEKFKFEDLSIDVSISLGVSEIRDEIDSPETLLKKADEALYKAKETGRNKVVMMN